MRVWEPRAFQSVVTASSSRSSQSLLSAALLPWPLVSKLVTLLCSDAKMDELPMPGPRSQMRAERACRGHARLRLRRGAASCTS